jgi:ATP-dependent DNA helicase DinG
MPNQDWRPHFPLPTPRPDQARALDWICDQFEAGHRRIVCELGTGIGKSAIAVTVAAWLEAREGGTPPWAAGATVLTSQKVLQDQYVRDFAVARDLRASANFQCSGPVGGTCGETSRVRKAVGMELAGQKLRCTQCPYRVSKDAFVASHLGITNYSYHLSEALYAGELPPRRLLVLDEAHNVEDEVRRWTSVELTEKDAADMGLDLGAAGKTEESAIEWLSTSYRSALRNRLAKLSGKLTSLVKVGKLDSPSVKTLANDNDTADKRLCQANRLIDRGGRLLVSWHDDPVKMRRSIRFQPIDVRGLVEELLYSKSSATLLMSATLLDREVFCASVGLPGAPYLSIPTPFRDEQFGLAFRPVGRMTQSHIERTLRDYPRAIRKILADNPGVKGIIHTTNYKITRALREALVDSRLLFQDSARDRETMLKRHIGSPEPTVLVSPSMMEGLDLRDDLGRFQVMCKVPYPDLSDPIVKHKDREWYAWRTVRTLTQAIGRSVRSDTDWTRTYILDESFMDVLDRNYEMVPIHLRRGMTVEDWK